MKTAKSTQRVLPRCSHPFCVQALTIGLLITIALLLSSCASIRPIRPFTQMDPPPAPDYAQPNAWLALPNRNGIERSTPPGLTAVDEMTALADVFFIHPTMYLKNDIWNAAYDAAGKYDKPVLLAQASAFNSCCRIYAPHYRQASLVGLSEPAAVALAYSDVASAFEYYVAHFNKGRPFVIASHSQGTGHAMRLLQEKILGTPLQEQLVVAYTIGAYTPSNFATIGLPTCNKPEQTGCIISWNTSQTGRTGANRLTRDVLYWWQGSERRSGALPAICVNPLTWTEHDAADAMLNTGSLPFPSKPFPTTATTLSPLQPHLTAAVCRGGLLNVDLPWTSEFRDALAILTGSYHGHDYGLFYGNIRANALLRVENWLDRRAEGLCCMKEK
ncbi:DUF3089 domain-containing protein [Ochrobactrum sp. SFR4]|uniref:DUF3089 domain-containing protein n=1 Tax=Ochrobactrum sp. SFR4 TaxID=2717368 RepID=UPI001C8BB481|nr:DUF3089 domain-containing protein [Ochrobactrum sp. SFR4]MBX8827435.1 DUF3089 domain-containing protein [Ochrobactrum sp. SFR4]